MTPSGIEPETFRLVAQCLTVAVTKSINDYFFILVTRSDKSFREVSCTNFSCECSTGAICI